MTVKRVLKECPVFRRLTDDQLEEVAALSREEVYGAGASIFHAGTNAGHLFVVVEGKVALQMELPARGSELRKRIAVDAISRGELLGWSSMVEPNIYPLSAVCLQRTTVLAIDASRLASLLEEDCSIAREVLQGLTGVVALRLHDALQLLVAERSLV